MALKTGQVLSELTYSGPPLFAGADIDNPGGLVACSTYGILAINLKADQDSILTIYWYANTNDPDTEKAIDTTAPPLVLDVATYPNGVTYKVPVRGNYVSYNLKNDTASNQTSTFVGVYGEYAYSFDEDLDGGGTVSTFSNNPGTVGIFSGEPIQVTLLAGESYETIAPGPNANFSVPSEFVVDSSGVITYIGTNSTFLRIGLDFYVSGGPAILIRTLLNGTTVLFGPSSDPISNATRDDPYFEGTADDPGDLIQPGDTLEVQVSYPGGSGPGTININYLALTYQKIHE